ncbi:hypothetical protein Tco_1250195, partial [Tanacetum coccineum]
MPEDPYVEAALQAPPSLDYVHGPEEPKQAPPSSDPEADPEEEDDKDPEEDPVDYLADRGDDRDDEDEPSEEDEDDDFDMEADGDEEEEEEHPAPADFVVVSLPATDQAPSTEETDPFSTDAEVAKLLAISTPPSSPLSLWSSPLPHIPSPSLPLSPPLPVLSPAPPPSPIHSLGYRAAMIRMRADPILYHYHHPSYSPPPDQMHHHQGYHH